MIAKKKDRVYAWIALVLLLFSWIPLLGVFLFLPAAMYLSIKQIRLVKRNAKKYGGYWLAVVVLVLSVLSFIAGVLILTYSINI